MTSRPFFVDWQGGRELWKALPVELARLDDIVCGP
jgi:hypothetical protein